MTPTRKRAIRDLLWFMLGGSNWLLLLFEITGYYSLAGLWEVTR